MKKLLPIILISQIGILCTISSCSKNGSNSNVSVVDSNYSITTGGDITITTKDNSTYTINTAKLTKVSESITFTVSGLPANVSCSNASCMNGSNANLIISSDFAISGTYPLTITGKSAKGATQTATVNLILTPCHCSNAVVGLGLNKFITTVDGSTHPVLMESGNSDQLTIPGIYTEPGTGTSYTANMRINCESKTFYIDSMGSPSSRGSGSFTDDTLKLNFKVFTSTGTVNGTNTYYRQ